jgi:hypothetical protein
MEKIKVLLLASILAVLLVIAFRPRGEIGRFIESDAGSFILTDTKTGQWCLAVKQKSPDSDMPYCRDLR